MSLTSLEVTDLFDFSRTNPSSIDEHLTRFAHHHPGLKSLQWALDHLPIGNSFPSLESVSLWTESIEALDAVIQPMTDGNPIVHHMISHDPISHDPTSRSLETSKSSH